MISHPHWILSHLSVSQLKLFRERNHYLGLLKQLDVKLEKEIAYTNNLRKLETSKLETNSWHTETQSKAK